MPRSSGPAPTPLQTSDRKWLQRLVHAFIRWLPLGGSSGLVLVFLVNSRWVEALLTFPVTLITVVWVAYTENFLARMEEVAAERGRQDASRLVHFLSTLDRAIRWHLAKPEAKYMRCQADDCLFNDIEGFQPPGPIKIPLLEEVFVSLELSDSFGCSLEGGMFPIQMGSHPLPPELSKQLEQSRLTIWDLLARGRKETVYRRLAILAWGGYGKTTLLRHITYTYAKERHGRYNVSSGGPVLLRRYKIPQLVPILLYLRQWGDLLGQVNPPTLPDLITHRHIPKLPGGEQLVLPENWAINLLQRGDALVMLDGFDEVAEEDRPTVNQWINTQMRNYPRSFFIITSRPGGYQHYRGKERPRRTVFVKPYKEKQWQAFIHKWYLCQERTRRSESKRNPTVVTAIAKKAADDLIWQVSRRRELKSMATNPLLLNMLVVFHHFYPGNSLPRRRVELYRAICRLQLGDRPLHKGIEMPLPADESREVLSRLALEMVGENRPQMPQRSLTECLQNYLNDLNTGIEADVFLNQIAKVSELLVERDDHQKYEFTHLSFQSYLAATQIKQEQRESVLLENCDKSWWQETILLYAAQVNPTSLIEGLIEREATDLAYRCLQETPERIAPELKKQLKAVRAKVQGVRYQQLKDYLQRQRWKEADFETYRLMIQTVNKEDGQYLDQDDLLNFPLNELRQIDRLWVTYSYGRFGFSVQKKIYLDCGATDSEDYPGDEVWHHFCRCVGWRTDRDWLAYPQLTFSLDAPGGHLPRARSGIWLSLLLFPRLDKGFNA